jgi:signal transduction histidine kinase
LSPTFIPDPEYRDKPLDKEGEEMMEMMETKIRTMHRLIEDVLKTAKEEEKVKEKVNLSGLINEVLGNLNPPSHFHILVQKNLPEVFYHKLSLMQILQNLISNAIKYMDKPQPLISIGLTDYDHHYQICISDNGPGIPEKKQNNIFQIFESGSDIHDSHGIGLSIVKQLVEEHGGKVWLESKEGEGSSFYFTIPKNP